ncbi:YihY/virulence factor BrkB family protein [Ponticoccus sp. SC2-23]|uniref:YihY/virulence factor BrkB family protein n=1 Tax=Alexandriicola marinus TaxID=2081710 RepID=UPI000FD9F6A4|nr:YihY/virulence factor BrkB family protein [Alexandriicola marinus]MBM1219552.1 YihY/virulence factor BrkB family protein [Ponticoccus sp. SC6-9]MBM1223376.1 YihY/virulence factor BrkB family protein [Ponticoccus sp. SC6-15]MBM1229365.1 YihY/virulence factor BrkB family protein [Ponticoccus sp. SC6-38]MBM1232342.1 YihY/virulence factor BrkB family protein [Ponticoccus sp. SC6-45]MBM1237708.1 YihY/virulence factor BrkB family protein [Ponticoccus sp. SC6-49]MBM1241353.1 YihY/virulence factor
MLRLFGGAKALWSVYLAAERANLTLISAGVAFFGMFAIFPAMAALIAIFGLVADPAVVETQLELMQDVIPAEAYNLFHAQLMRLLGARSETLGWATALSTGLALWSTRAGVAALMRGLNVIHGGRNRSGLRHYAVALMLTICLIGIAVLALLVVVVSPILLAFLPLPVGVGLLLSAVRWLAALFILMAALGLLYRFGPNRADQRTAWITPGSIFVVVTWLIASMGFSAYLSNFGSYNEVYGSIGAVVAMMMWLYISTYLVLFGAVLNVELASAGLNRATSDPPANESDAKRTHTSDDPASHRGAET